METVPGYDRKSQSTRNVLGEGRARRRNFEKVLEVRRKSGREKEVRARWEVNGRGAGCRSTEGKGESKNG